MGPHLANASSAAGCSVASMMRRATWGSSSTVGLCMYTMDSMLRTCGRCITSQAHHVLCSCTASAPSHMVRHAAWCAAHTPTAWCLAPIYLLHELHEQHECVGSASKNSSKATEQAIKHLTVAALRSRFHHMTSMACFRPCATGTVAFSTAAPQMPCGLLAGGLKDQKGVALSSRRPRTYNTPV